MGTRLATALERATPRAVGVDLDSLGEPIARVARPLVDFMMLAQDEETHARLARAAVLRLRSAAGSD
jgi:hypothetical protein